MKSLSLAVSIAATLSIVLFSRTTVSAAKPAPGIQVGTSFETSDGANVEYLVYLPKTNANRKEETEGDGKHAPPLVVFLHGRGESHGPLSLVAKWGPPKFAERGDSLPYVLVSPQCPTDDSWSSGTQLQRLDELISHTVELYNVDRSRIYLTGLSMGGYGSWALAANHPERFAAVVPICGYGNPKTAEKLVDVPIWAFHGDQDTAVKFSGSADIIAAIKKAGGTKVRFTTMEHVGHNSWSPAYATTEMWYWMLSHRSGDETQNSDDK